MTAPPDLAAPAAPRRGRSALFDVEPAAPGRPSLEDRLELLLFGGILLLSLLTPPFNAAGEPNAPLMGALQEATGGGLCMFRRATGIDCAGCCLSRAFVQLAHGSPAVALSLNPLAPAVFAWVLLRVVELVALNAFKVVLRHRIPDRWVWRGYGAVLLGLIVLGGYRVARGVIAS